MAVAATTTAATSCCHRTSKAESCDPAYSPAGQRTQHCCRPLIGREEGLEAELLERDVVRGPHSRDGREEAEASEVGNVEVEGNEKVISGRNGDRLAEAGDIRVRERLVDEREEALVAGPLPLLALESLEH